MRALIVDDEAGIRGVLRRWLEAEGVEVVDAATAEEALGAMARLDPPPGVALCDIRLPGKDGLWLANQLDTFYPDTAVVMTTGVHDFETAVRSLQSGVVDYVSKPFERKQVLDAYRRAFFAHTSRLTVASMTRELERPDIPANLVALVPEMIGVCRTQFPRECGVCGRRFSRFEEWIALTDPIASPTFDESCDDPIGMISWVNCSCGTTLVLHCGHQGAGHDAFAAVLAATSSSSGLTPAALLQQLRREVRRQVGVA